MNYKLNVDAKFIPKMKNEVEKAVNNLDIKRQAKEVYEQLFHVVEKTKHNYYIHICIKFVFYSILFYVYLFLY